MSKYFTVASRAALIRIGCNKCLVHRTLLLRKPVFEQQEPTRPGHPEASSVDPPLVIDPVVAPAALPYEPMNASISIPDDGPLVNICVSLELDLQLDVRPTVVGSYSHDFIFSIHINSSLILLLNKVFFLSLVSFFLGFLLVPMSHRAADIICHLMKYPRFCLQGMRRCLQRYSMHPFWLMSTDYTRQL